MNKGLLIQFITNFWSNLCVWDPHAANAGGIRDVQPNTRGCCIL